MEKDRQNYKVARITLDKKKYLPTEVRLLDDSGLEIVYSFDSVVVNDRNIKSQVKKFFGIESDPYHPSLKGYKLYIPPDDPIEMREIRQAGGDGAPGRPLPQKTSNAAEAPGAGKRSTAPTTGGSGTKSIR